VKSSSTKPQGGGTNYTYRREIKFNETPSERHNPSTHRENKFNETPSKQQKTHRKAKNPKRRKAKNPKRRKAKKPPPSRPGSNAEIHPFPCLYPPIVD